MFTQWTLYYGNSRFYICKMDTTLTSTHISITDKFFKFIFFIHFLGGYTSCTLPTNELFNTLYLCIVQFTLFIADNVKILKILSFFTTRHYFCSTNKISMGLEHKYHNFVECEMFTINITRYIFIWINISVI